MPGTYDPKRTLAETRRTPDKPYAFPEKITPKALTRDRAVGGLLAYDVTNSAAAGANSDPRPVSEPIASQRFAGQRNWRWMPKRNWRRASARPVPTGVDAVPRKPRTATLPLRLRPVLRVPLRKAEFLAQLAYRGIAKSSLDRTTMAMADVVSAAVTFLLIGCVLLVVSIVSAPRCCVDVHRSSTTTSRVDTTCHALMSVLLSAPACCSVRALDAAGRAPRNALVHAAGQLAARLHDRRRRGAGDRDRRAARPTAPEALT